MPKSLPLLDSAVEDIYIAEEVHHEGRGRLFEDLVGCASLFDLSVVHHHHLVGEFEGLLLVVRHEHAGHADLVVQPPQPLPQFHSHLGIERAEGLVEQEDLRPDGQRAGECHPLSLST